jgi:mono/diheme cytochrome c family protein
MRQRWAATDVDQGERHCRRSNLDQIHQDEVPAVLKPRLIALVAIPYLASPAFAEGNAKMGRVLAEYWCFSCHAQTRSTTATDAVPTLESVARRPGRTPDTLKAWLTNPHGKMPNLALTRSEIDDLVAYLVTLRR